MMQKTVGALCAVDYKGAGNQYVQDGKLILCNAELQGMETNGDRCKPTGNRRNVRGGSETLVSENNIAGTLDASYGKGPGERSGKERTYLADESLKVRRLTPLECERLQGYPDGWTDIGEWMDTKGKKHETSDSARYKALGNSIALPFWKVLCKRISAQYDRDATMCSLFDGIGGFPFLWEQINGKGSAVWASEIEEFPIAVTTLHFPEVKE